MRKREGEWAARRGARLEPSQMGGKRKGKRGKGVQKKVINEINKAMRLKEAIMSQELEWIEAQCCGMKTE